MRLTRIFIVASLTMLSGCSNGFDPMYLVNSLRLLDVKAEPAELPGGAKTVMKASWANPGKPAPAISWDLCTLQVPPGSGTITNEKCIQPDMTVPYLVPIGMGDGVSFTMPTIPLTQLGLPDSTDGFYVPIRLRLTDGMQQVTAIFPLRYYPAKLSPNTPNRNPTLMGLFRVPFYDAGASMQMEVVAGMPPDVHKGEEVDLRALLTPDSAETYVVLNVDPNTGAVSTTAKMETVSVTWLVTGGQLSDSVTGEAKPTTKWTLDKYLPASGTTIDMWLVARDERGGSDIMHRTFNFK